MKKVKENFIMVSSEFTSRDIDWPFLFSQVNRPYSEPESFQILPENEFERTSNPKDGTYTIKFETINAEFLHYGIQETQELSLDFSLTTKYTVFYTFVPCQETADFIKKVNFFLSPEFELEKYMDYYNEYNNDLPLEEALAFREELYTLFGETITLDEWMTESVHLIELNKEYGWVIDVFFIEESWYDSYNQEAYEKYRSVTTAATMEGGELQ